MSEPNIELSNQECRSLVVVTEGKENAENNRQQTDASENAEKKAQQSEALDDAEKKEAVKPKKKRDGTKTDVWDSFTKIKEGAVLEGQVQLLQT